MLNENITGLYRTSSGWLWLATTFGLSEFSPDPLADGGQFINYTRQHGLSDAGLRSITEDDDGNLWLASESGGAMKVIRRGFTSTQKLMGWNTNALLRSARIAVVS